MNIKWSVPKKQSWFERYTSQPHQLFFSFATIFSIVIMGATFLSLIGKNIDFRLFHGFGFLFGLFTNAFLGFLLTVIPKYTISSPIKQNIYIPAWIGYELGILIGLFIDESLGKMITAITLLFIVFEFFNIIKAGEGKNKKESTVLNILLFFGAILLFIEVFTGLYLSVFIFWSYLCGITFVVAQRMVPAFYSQLIVSPWKKPTYLLEISLLLLFLIGISLELHLQNVLLVSSFVSILFFGYVIYKLDIFHKNVPSILWILSVAFVWFEIGIISLFVETLFEVYTLKLSLHIMALGFIGSLLIGFGSRVIMGHSNPPQSIVADRLTTSIFMFLQVIVLMRITASILVIFGSPISSGFLHLASFSWIVLFLIWGNRYKKSLFTL